MSVTIVIPQQLRSYTGGATQARVEGANIRTALAALDAKYPGIRFRVIDEQDRIRPHMRIFADGERAHTIDAALASDSELHILGALSGG